MASTYPNNLVDLCSVCNISFFNLHLDCLFCKHKLTILDLAGFHQKQLSVVWRNDKAFGSCSKCLRLTANYERENYYRCSVKGSLISGLLKTPLKDITVRCLYCFQLLDLIEKTQHHLGDRDFHLVRNHWRGCCRNCYSYEG